MIHTFVDLILTHGLSGCMSPSCVKQGITYSHQYEIIIDVETRYTYNFDSNTLKVTQTILSQRIDQTLDQHVFGCVFLCWINVKFGNVNL